MRDRYGAPFAMRYLAFLRGAAGAIGALLFGAHLTIGRPLIGDDSVSLILCDNVFEHQALTGRPRCAKSAGGWDKVCRYGIVDIYEGGRIH